MKFLNFSLRPAHTLIYITSEKTFRIDIDRKGVIIGPIQAIEVLCENAAGLPYCLETVCKQSSKFGAKLWLLFERLSTYSLNLPSIQVEGVSEEILQQALQFEYEALTGNSAMKNELAYRFLGEADDMSHYWITTVAKETLNKLIAHSKKAGSKFAGLLHPGGLPKPWTTDEAVSSWLRIETWGQEALIVAQKPDTGFALHVVPMQGHTAWKDELTHWIDEFGRVEKTDALMASDIHYVPDTDSVHHLTVENDFLYWLGLWAKHLALKFTFDVPVLNTQRKVNHDLIYMLAGGIGAFLVCSSDFSWNMYLQNRYEQDFAFLQQMEKEIAGLRKGINSGRDKKRKLEEQLANLGGNISIIPYAIASLQKRPAELLYRLAKASPEDLIIEQISSDQTQVIISGVALLPHMPNELAEQVESDFAAIAWQVNPPTKKDMALFEEGGPWSFEMMLDDTGLAGFMKQSL